MMSFGFGLPPLPHKKDKGDKTSFYQWRRNSLAHSQYTYMIKPLYITHSAEATHNKPH